MVALPVIPKVADWHEVSDLQCIPVVEAGGPGTDEIATDKNVED